MAISDIVKNAGERQLRELAEAGVRAKQALRGVREHAVKTMGEVIGTAEAGVTAFGFGYLRGRYGSEGELSVLGVPVDLAVALGLKGMAFADAFDRYNTDAHAIGQGALDSYLTAMGVRFGLESKKESAATTAAVKGEYAAVGAARPHIGVTAEELAQETCESPSATAFQGSSLPHESPVSFRICRKSRSQSRPPRPRAIAGRRAASRQWRSGGRSSGQFEGTARILGARRSTAAARGRALRIRDCEGKMHAELERTLHFNEVFMAILGHDLRTPLAAITTGAQCALRMSNDERLTPALRRIVSSSERMERMIGQVQDLGRARVGGGIELKRKPTEIEALCSELVTELERTSPDSIFEVQVVGDTVGTWDADRLAEALSNLLSNPIEHGSQGVPVALRIDGTDPAWVSIQVHNEGTIEPNTMPIVFEPFA
jgi:hypothetical protein